MKQKMPYLVIILLVIICIFSEETEARGSRSPKVQPPPVNPTPTVDLPSIEQLKYIAATSNCIRTSWKDRGRAPAGYIKGMAITYARSLCRLKVKDSLSLILSAGNTNIPSKDVLSHFQPILETQSILNIDAFGEDPLRALYTIGIGLGMRESSGSYCEGWDRAAGSNRSSSAAEAGIFQTSYDSIKASPELEKLYQEYKRTPERCFLETFKEGVRCKTLNILGSGPGAEYQAFNINCPAFATEYAMAMLRIQRKHYGPINRKEAQVVPACYELIKKIQDFIETDPYVCQDIF